jgi:Cu/Zn superoxide dismutase
MHYRISALAGLLVLGSSGFALAQMASPSAMMSSDSKPVTIKLSSQNNSGETATATLAQTGDDVKVTVVTNGGTGMQPIHIHEGTCAKLNPKPKYPLTTVDDGKSVTTLKGLKLTDLETGGYAINIHKSTTDIATYVACGDIPKI